MNATISGAVLILVGATALVHPTEGNAQMNQDESERIDYATVRLEADLTRLSSWFI